MNHQMFHPPMLTMLTFVFIPGAIKPPAGDCHAITTANSKRATRTYRYCQTTRPKEKAKPLDGLSSLFSDAMPEVSRNVVRHYLSGSLTLLSLMLPSENTQ